MNGKLLELWLQYAADDLKSAKVLLSEGVYNKNLTGATNLNPVRFI